MPLDLQRLFATQAAWQRGRARLSWPEKIRMAELMREAAETLRGERASVLRRDVPDLHPQPSRPPAPPFG